MSHRRFHDPSHHEPFAFTQASEDQIAWWERKYPTERRASAVIPALWVTQKQNAGWLSEPALRAVADRLGMTYIRVYEIATFYTMFQLKPKGKYLLQVCTTTPCWLRGSEAVMKACQHAADGEIFSVQEVECLGACANAPMVQVDGHDGSEIFYEDLTMVTRDFTRDDTRRNCTKIKKLVTEGSTLYPEVLYSYFPLLSR